MWFLKRPSDERIGAFLLQQAQQPFSYPEVGATATAPPAGYTVDHNQVQLGSGQAVFAAACEALRRWQQFPASIASIQPPNAPLQAGYTVSILARAFGVWSLFACRIVYVIDEVSPVRRFGLASGTLPDHIVRGEERFLIEHRADDSVWYDVLAFSRPRFWLMRLASPVTRRLQRRFAHESKAAMSQAVSRPPAG